MLTIWCEPTWEEISFYLVKAMRWIIFFLQLVFVPCLSAQTVHFYGKVLDDKGAGIPFATVGIKDKNQGVYCDELGNFSFSAPLDSIKGIVFHCVGYKEKVVEVSSKPTDPIIVKLERNEVILGGVLVKGEKNAKYRVGYLGKKTKHYGDCYYRSGDEIAIFLPPQNRNKGFVKEVYVYITNEGIFTNKFRVHIYEIDTTRNSPGRDISDGNIIVAAIKGNEWVKVDVSEKNIPVGQGVFVSMEWISGYGNNISLLQSKKNPVVEKYHSPVLGLSKTHIVRLDIFWRDVFKDDWHQQVGTFGNFGLVPMIYGTYTYKRK